MRDKFIIGIIAFVTIALIGVNIFFQFHRTENQILNIHVLDQWINQPFDETHTLSTENGDVDLKIHYYSDYKDLLSADKTSNAIFIFDAVAYLEHKSDFENFSILALRPKQVSLVINPQNSEISSIKDLKGPVLGVSSKASDEYLFRSVIDKEGLVGIALDEVTFTDPVEKIEMLTDGYIEYAFLESPYLEIAVEKGAGVLYNFDNCYDALIVSKELDEKIFAELPKLIRTYNENMKAYSGVLLKETSIKNIESYRDKLRTLMYPFEKPDVEVINKLATYFFATNRIDEKYTFAELVIEGF